VLRARARTWHRGARDDDDRRRDDRTAALVGGNTNAPPTRDRARPGCRRYAWVLAMRVVLQTSSGRGHETWAVGWALDEPEGTGDRVLGSRRPMFFPPLRDQPTRSSSRSSDRLASCSKNSGARRGRAGVLTLAVSLRWGTVSLLGLPRPLSHGLPPSAISAAPARRSWGILRCYAGQVGCQADTARAIAALSVGGGSISSPSRAPRITSHARAFGGRGRQAPRCGHRGGELIAIAAVPRSTSRGE